MADKATDLRAHLLDLYLVNNPEIAHRVFIYSYNGVVSATTNPFQMVFADLEPQVKKSLIMQNLASGEMVQAFIVPLADAGGYQIENVVLYGNKAGVLLEIDLGHDKIEQSEKYKQFLALAQHLLRQFVVSDGDNKA